MTLSVRARTALRLAPVALAAAVLTTFGVAATVGTQAANANPVLLANMRLMDHAAMSDSDTPTIHTMVVPASGTVDASETVSATTLAARAGLSLDPLSEPVPAAENPALVAAAATAPAGTPHMSNLLDRHVAPSCLGTGADGNRVQVVYAYESGSANDLARKEATIRNEIANIDDVFALSSAETGGGKRVRWVTDANCLPQIIVAPVPAGSISYAGSTNPAGYWNTLKSHLSAQGLNRADRKYLVFGDAPAANPGICGLGDMYMDDSATANYNDGYAAQFGIVFQACFAASTNDSTYAGHELVHTLGAVQASSPNASQYGHCTDDGDLMCYPDGSTAPIRQVCPATHEPLLDCGNNDYFSTNPPAGTYLATKWNTANSSFLDTVAALAPAPALTLSAPSSATTGQALTFTASMSPAPQTIEWLRDGIVIPAATGATYTWTPLYYEAGTRAMTARATLADGRKVSTTRSVPVAKAAAPTVVLNGPSTATTGTDITFTATRTGIAPFTHRWTYPTGYCTAKGATDTNVLTLTCPTVPGTLSTTVGVSLTQGDGQSVSTSRPLTVQPAPMTVTIDGPASLTVGQSATYTANVQNVPAGWSVSWNDNPASPTWIEQGYFTAPATKITARAIGTITLEAFVYSSQTGQSMTVSRTIQGVAAPTAKITGPASTPAAFTATYSASLAGASASTYAWTSTQGWITSGAASPTITLTPQAAGTDTLTLTVTTTAGARLTSSMTVNATPAYAATLTVPPTITPHRAAAVTVTPNRSSTVRWSTSLPGCTIAAPTALATTLTCTVDRVEARVTATLTDTVTGQVITREASTSISPAIQPVATGWTVAATGTHPVTISGVLTTMSKAPLVGVPVTVQRAAYGSTTYLPVATVTTNTLGRATYAAPATAAASYRFVYAGTATEAASTSPATLVKVPTLAGLSVTAGYPTTFHGQVLNAATKKPLPAGTPVTLRVKWYGTSTWANVITLKTDANGKVAWKWNATRNGYFHLVYAGNASTLASGSATPLVRIPTKMTMGVKTGRPDVISGRLSTGAGVAMKSQYVTLQYRTYGTSTWRTVTRLVTNSTGSVAYKVQPKRKTYYRWVYGGTSTGYLAATSPAGYVTY